MTQQQATELAVRLSAEHPRSTFKVQAISDSWGGGYRVEQHGPCPECGKDLGFQGRVCWDNTCVMCPKCVNDLFRMRRIRAEHIALKLAGKAE